MTKQKKHIQQHTPQQHVWRSETSGVLLMDKKLHKKMLQVERNSANIHMYRHQNTPEKMNRDVKESPL